MLDKVFGGLLALGLTAWLGWTYYSSGNLESPKYRVLEERDGYEIRRYEPYLVAQVTVEGDYREALNTGFRKLAGYIFGGNQSRQSVAMTAPVTEGQGEKIDMTAPVTEQQSEKIAMTVPVTEQQSEKIAMTAPVTEREGSGRRTIRFMMPSQYSLETLPVPDDPSVEFVEVPAKTVAVSTFTWYPTGDRVARKKRELVRMVAESDLTAASEPTLATYNDPFSFPLLIKNEIWVEVEDPGRGEGGSANG